MLSRWVRQARDARLLSLLIFLNRSPSQVKRHIVTPLRQHPTHSVTLSVKLITVALPHFEEAWRAGRFWRGRPLQSGFRLQELAYCLTRPKAIEHLGARWAAKEAASRLSGEPWWRFKLLRSPDGAPKLIGPGGPWLVSLSHDRAVASAWVQRRSPTPKRSARLRASQRCRGGSSRRPQGCWSCRQRPCSSLRGRPGRSARRTGGPPRYGRPRPCCGRGARR